MNADDADVRSSAFIRGKKVLLQIEIKRSVTGCQPKFSLTTTAARWPNSFAYAAAVKTRTTASANVAGSSASNNSTPFVSG